MKDIYGDLITVGTCPDDYEGNAVEVVRAAFETADGYAAMHLTPKKARKLARKLNKAADEVEGVEPVRSAYTLRLTQDQATTLAVILDRVGGTTGLYGLIGGPVTARKYADQVAQALREAGVRYSDNDPRFAVRAHMDSIHFIGVAE